MKYLENKDIKIGALVVKILDYKTDYIHEFDPRSLSKSGIR